MSDVRKLIKKLAAQEAQLSETQFLAPCVSGGKVRTKVANIIYIFIPQPGDFEGWGIFQPVNRKAAELVDEASLPQLAEYLKLLKPLKLRLAYSLQGQTWLAYPVNESDMQQRLGVAKPMAVHLVKDAIAFDQIIARFDGNSCWYEESDRKGDPQVSETFRERLREATEPSAIRFSGITPEMVTTYDLAFQQTEVYRSRQREANRRNPRPPRSIQQRRREDRNDETRLREALQVGGGDLQEFRDRGDYWQVEWTTRDGERHASAIDKNDLTVVSSGICLSGRDRDFDLQSLVGVIEKQYQDWD